MSDSFFNKVVFQLRCNKTDLLTRSLTPTSHIPNGFMWLYSTEANRASLTNTHVFDNSYSLDLDGTFIRLYNGGFNPAYYTAGKKFCLDLKFRLKSFPTATSTLFEATTGNTAGLFRVSVLNTGQIRINTTSTANVTTALENTLVLLNTDYHLAVEYTGTELQIRLNGVLVETITTTITGSITTTSSTSVYIGSNYTGVATDRVDGYIDDVRMMVGDIRWGADFTPPTNSDYSEFDYDNMGYKIIDELKIFKKSYIGSLSDGNSEISDIAKKADVPTKMKLSLLERNSKNLLRVEESDIDGSFRFHDLSDEQTYMIIGEDYESNEVLYNAYIRDFVRPNKKIVIEQPQEDIKVANISQSFKVRASNFKTPITITPNCSDPHVKFFPSSIKITPENKIGYFSILSTNTGIKEISFTNDQSFANPDNISVEIMENLDLTYTDYINALTSKYNTRNRITLSIEDGLKRLNASLGENIIKNGDFSNGKNNWLDGTNLTSVVVDGAIQISRSGAINTAAAFRQTFETVPGEQYGLWFTTSLTNSACEIRNTGGSAIIAGASYSLGKSALVFSAVGNSTTINFWASGDGTTTRLDDIVVCKIDSTKCILFEDNNGNTPVIDMNKPIGLMLDTSKQLGREPNLFDGNHTTGWTVGAGIVAAADKLTFTAAANTESATRSLLLANKVYEVKFRIQNYTSGSLQVIASSSRVSDTLSSNGTYTRKMVCTDGVGNIGFKPVTAFTGEVVLLSVKRIKGNHIYQPSNTASRPIVSRKVNLLQDTEDFRTSYWNKNRANPTTASRVEATETNVNGFQINKGGITIPSGGKILTSVRLTKGNKNWALVTVYDGGSNGVRQWINLTSGALGTSNTFGSGVSKVSATVIQIDSVTFDLYFEVQMVGTSLTVAVYPAVSGDAAFDCTIGDYGFLSRIDTRSTTDIIGLPSYQKVVNLIEYDKDGFPAFCTVDGADDWLETIDTLDLSSTEAVMLMMVVRKDSDAATAALFELNTSSTAANGTLALFLPVSSGVPNSTFRSRGTSPADATTTLYAAPHKGIWTGIGRISTDTSILRVNGVQAVSSTVDQGIGNYGNYRGYFFRRAGTTIPFMGRFYGGIIEAGHFTTDELNLLESLSSNEWKVH